MGIFRDYNLTHDSMKAKLLAFISEQGRLYRRLRLRTVAVKSHEDKWVNGITLLHLWPKRQKELRSQPRKYATMQLLEEWQPIEKLQELMEDINVRHVLEIQGITLNLDTGTVFRAREFEANANSYSDYPGWVYSASRNHPPPVPHEPLLEPKLPIYLNGMHAIEDWTSLDGISQSDVRFGGIVLFAPECRLRLAELGISDGSHLTGVLHHDAPLPKGLEVKGAWISGSKRTSFIEPVKQNIKLPIPEGTSGFGLYLVGANGTLYDFHDETGSWTHGGRRVLGGLPSGPLGQKIDAALRTCECENVEFKPYVEIGNPKDQELVETVIAFSNTKGGIILMGVDKHSVVTGIERELYKLAQDLKCTPEEAPARYAGRIRTLIGDNLNRGVPLEISPVILEGHKVLAIYVPEGSAKPYAKKRPSNDILVRRGSNNIRPDPDHELPELLKSPLGRTRPFGF